MSDVAAVFRARLASALRDLPTELGGAAPESCRPRTACSDLRAFAEQLESASPGLALMMQLRARLFGRAAASASRRGFGQVVMVGRGFGARVRQEDCTRVRVVEIEHPAVLDAWEFSRGRQADVATLAAADLEHGSWSALNGSEFAPRYRRTLFLIESISLWGSANALAFWMDVLGRESGAGSEMLVNVLDADSARRAREAVESVPDTAAATFATPTGIDVATIHAAIAVHSLELLHIFDSLAVQRAYLGFADLFVREHYLWMRAPGALSCTSEKPLETVFRSHPRPVACGVPLRPRLRDGAWARPHPSGTTRLGFPVTALRACSTSLSAGDLAAVSLLDGHASSTEIALTLGQLDEAYSLDDVARLVRRLQARGLLAYDSADPACSSLAASLDDEPRSRLREASAHVECRLSMIRELAFVALQTRDRALRRRVLRLLEDFDDNIAANHLRRLLEADDVVVARDGSVAVGARCPVTTQGLEQILAATIETVGAIGKLLDIRVASPVFVDVGTRRDAIPITMVADAVPYTLVRIPRQRYCSSVLYHEITHALAMCGSIWLSEGLAVWVQRRLAPGPCFPDDSSAVRSPRGRSLADHLAEEVQRGAGRLDATDYREAGDYVAWLVSRFGLPTFARIFDACWAGAGGPVDAACQDLGFESLRHFEQEWRSAG